MKNIIILTGASRGIGRSIATQLKSLDTEIWLLGRNKQELKNLEQELEQIDSTWLIDLQQSSSIFETLEAIKLRLSVESSHRQLVGIINNAGIFKTQQTQDLALDIWQETFQVNFFAAVQITETLLPFLIKRPQAAIVNIASTLGLRANQNTGAYGASKAALIHWTQTLALECAPLGIRANAICPGIVETPIHSFHHIKDPQQKALVIKEMNTKQPLQRMGQPQDISAMVKYLFSTEASWITGSIINIDGGIHLT